VWATTPNATSIMSPPYGGTLDTTLEAPGNHTLWLLARDQAGNEGSSSCPVTIDQESNRPRITPTSLTLAGPNILGQNPAVLFSVEDDDSVDADMIQYSLDTRFYQGITQRGLLATRDLLWRRPPHRRARGRVGRHQRLL
jgi:hypothetical protein